MKDHEIAQLVNRLTQIAKDCGHMQSLRERIAHEVVPAIRKAQKESLLETAEWCDTQATSDWYGKTAGDMIRRMIEEIEK